MPQLNILAVKPLVLSATALVAAVLLAAAAWWFWPASRDGDPPVVASPSSTGTSARPPRTAGANPLPNAPEPSPAEQPTTDGIPSLDDLYALCGAPWRRDIEARCAAALTARYSGEGVPVGVIPSRMLGWDEPTYDLPPEEHPSWPIWEQAFANPSAVRHAVEEALSRDECRVPEGETRVDLAATCAAGEMAHLAMLHEGCVGALATHGDPNPLRREGDDKVWDWAPTWGDDDWRLHVDLLDRDATLPPEKYWRRRTEVDDQKYRFAWRLMSCRQVPPTALAWLEALPTPSGKPWDASQSRSLARYASRLGNEWARRHTERLAKEYGD